MIKAEDLSIGDIVRVNCICALAEGTIGTIVEISKGTNTNNKKEFVKLIPINSISNWGWGVLCDNIEGIPLTPEILERNGFEMREDTVVYAKNRLALKPLDDEKGYQVGLGSLRLFYVKVSVIKYVHELQNILYWIDGENANLTI